MTLILALDCADGMVLASDSQGTLGAVRQEWQKIFIQHDNMAWGGAGNLGIVQRVREHISTNLSLPSYFNAMPSDQIKTRVSDAVTKVVRPLLVDRRLTATDNELTDYLFVGHSSRGSFIINLGSNLMDMDHITVGYHAIGSGGPLPLLALAGLAHYDIRNRTLREAKLIAYRVMEDAIRVASQGLGMPIQMIEISKPTTGHGRARALGDDEISELGTAVLQWKDIEADSLSRYLDIHMSLPAASNPVPPISN